MIANHVASISHMTRHVTQRGYSRWVQIGGSSSRPGQQLRERVCKCLLHALITGAAERQTGTDRVQQGRRLPDVERGCVFDRAGRSAAGAASRASSGIGKSR